MIIPAKLCGLIVEDNEYSRSLAAEGLDKLGIGTVLEAADGTDGLQILHSQAVDFVILDWYMPEINGVGFIRLVRGGQVNCPPDIPVIIMTAYATRENIARMREMDLKEVLIKPFDVKQLSSAISSTLTSLTPKSADGEANDAATDDDEQILL